MKWVGLTGGIASGKSTVAKIILEAGFPVIDADQVARDVAAPGSPGLAQIVSKFGSQILNSKGELDRQKMATAVFGDKNKLLELESILHPLIRQQVQNQKKRLQDQNHSIAFYDVPLLFEKNMQKDFNEIILVTTSREKQLARMLKRDGFKLEEAEARLKNQIPLAEKESQASRIIYNNGSLEDLKTATVAVLQKIQSAQP